MGPKEFYAIRERLERIRKRDVVSSSMGIIPASIDFLDHAIREARSDGQKWHLYLITVGECVTCRRRDLEMHYRRLRRSEFPDDPFVVTSFAHALAYDEETRVEALAVAHEAVNAARARGTWIRYSVTWLARVATMVGDDEALTEALRQLIDEGSAWREEDYHLVTDFLDQIAPGRVDPALLEAYRLLAASDSDGSA